MKLGIVQWFLDALHLNMYFALGEKRYMDEIATGLTKETYNTELKNEIIK